jgi:hypothetical protein
VFYIFYIEIYMLTCMLIVCAIMNGFSVRLSAWCFDMK